MDSRVSPILEQLQLNHALFKTALADMSEAHIITRIDGGGNSAGWIAGHLASSRFVLGELIGLDLANPFGDLFARGAEVQDDSAYPPLADIVAAYETISEAIMARLGDLTASDLDKELGAPYPVQEPTVLNGIAFLAFHEAFHIGQLGYIRKLLGYQTLAG